jgi:hypothetical protein
MIPQKRGKLGARDRRTIDIRAENRDDSELLISIQSRPVFKFRTDALPSYAGLAADYYHEFVDHAEAYVRGAVHTNGMENFPALFKRCIKGTHVSVEPYHLEAYVDSEAFRFNNRTLEDGGRLVAALGGVNGKRLTYKQLIGAETDSEGALGSDNDGTSASLN